MHKRLYLLAAILAACGFTTSATAQQGMPGSHYGYSPAEYAMAAYQDPSGPPGMPGMMGGPSCDAGGGCGCGAACGGAGCGCGCCQGWCHKINVFGEYLYLRARNAEVAYAVPIDGALGAPPEEVQVGPVAIVDPDYDSAFRFGAGFTLNECNAVVVTYTQFDTTTADAVTLPGGAPATAIIDSLVSHPELDAAVGPLDAAANLQIQFKTLDVDYKGLIAYCDDYKVNYLIGARWGQIHQHFNASFTDIGLDTVRSDVEFDGGGLRLGLEGERYATNTGFFAYGKAVSSLVGGEFKTRYQSRDLIADTLIADTSWRSGRIITINDLEVGIGWRNYCDNLRLNVGYTYSFWTNTVLTREWINAVQQNNFVDQSDNFNGLISFDGLTARVEVLW
jgi:hypothetical protein